MQGTPEWHRGLQDSRFFFFLKDLPLLQINILISLSKFSFLSFIHNDLNLVPRDFHGYSVQEETK